jgi:hypothetical protein
MILSTAKVEDFDRWWNTFSTKGAEKRRQHGCKHSHVFRDPDDDHRVWVVFDCPTPRWSPSLKQVGWKGSPRRPSSSGSTTPNRLTTPSARCGRPGRPGS